MAIEPTDRPDRHTAIFSNPGVQLVPLGKTADTTATTGFRIAAGTANGQRLAIEIADGGGAITATQCIMNVLEDSLTAWRFDPPGELTDGSRRV